MARGGILVPRPLYGGASELAQLDNAQEDTPAASWEHPGVDHHLHADPRQDWRRLVKELLLVLVLVLVLVHGVGATLLLSLLSAG